MRPDNNGNQESRHRHGFKPGDRVSASPRPDGYWGIWSVGLQVLADPRFGYTQRLVLTDPHPYEDLTHLAKRKAEGRMGLYAWLNGSLESEATDLVELERQALAWPELKYVGGDEPRFRLIRDGSAERFVSARRALLCYGGTVRVLPDGLRTEPI